LFIAVATLIAADRLDRDAIFAAGDLLDQGAIQAIHWSWLDEGSAADVQCRAFEHEIRRIREAIEGRIEGVDVVVQPLEGREKRLLIADMDSTMIGQECIDELADYAGVKRQVAEITERAMHGELDFAGALRERVLLLQGLEETAIEQCLAERIRPNPGAETLVRTMRARGADTVLVSGGFTAFVEPIARRIGFERFEANILGASDGRLTGLTEGNIVDSRRKHDVLTEARDRLGLAREATLAIGDGANDIAMVAEAGLGIAYRAKPALAAVADARLDHNDLSALLWAQGIPRAEWIDD
jgi:phosphoserine phosphatase